MTGTGSTSSTRERILAAAAEIIQEDGVTARLSVRTVAARAEVSTGSLRHHFPTQQALRDELTQRIYDWVLPSRGIEDASVPARDRLVQCLRQVLAPTGTGEQAREAMTTLTASFISAEQTESVREVYLAMDRDGRQRIEGWLRAVSGEVDLPEAEIPRRARFLASVLIGLGLERALPAEDSLARTETETLYLAADAALRPAD